MTEPTTHRLTTLYSTAGLLTPSAFNTPLLQSRHLLPGLRQHGKVQIRHHHALAALLQRQHAPPRLNNHGMSKCLTASIVNTTLPGADDIALILYRPRP